MLGLGASVVLFFIFFFLGGGGVLESHFYKQLLNRDFKKGWRGGRKSLPETVSIRGEHPKVPHPEETGRPGTATCHSPA